MQASGAPPQRGFSQRTSQIDTQDEPSPAANGSTQPLGQPGVQPRSSLSSKSQSGNTRRSVRDSNREGSSSSNVPLSQIEKSVTHLLVATKQLLETLTQWSRGQATDTQVSDVYVRLGYEFNMACRAFTAINVDTSDLGNVPDLLRSILESTLSQEASAESLERYLPRIRDIIINLLHGLKRKQQRLRQRQGRERDTNGVPERSTSVSTVTSAGSGLSNMLDEGLESGGFQPNAARSDPRPTSNSGSSPTRRFNSMREQPRTSVQSGQSNTGSVMQNAPSLPYPPDEPAMPTSVSLGDLNVDAFPPPPPPPPEPQGSALAALQKGGDLERRASRRYSQYQISKHLGANGVPILPPQTTPIPNRGRKEARESLRAVQKRESVRHSRNLSNQSKTGVSPARVPSRVEEDAPEVVEKSGIDSPMAKTPDDKYAPTATLSGPLTDVPYAQETPEEKKEPVKEDAAAKVEVPAQIEPKNDDSYFQISPPPTPTKDLTLFLQYKSKVKKIVLPEGRDELSIGRLQLAFIEKFSWNTQQNGADLPEIYIQDPVSGIRHELEDLADIKDRTVLVLNVEALDEVKRHFDDGISSLTKMMKEMKNNVADQANTLQRVSDRQLDTASEVARLAALPPVTVQGDGSKPMVPGKKLSPGHVGDIQSLRRDLAVLRQTYSTFQSDVQSSISTIRQKAATVKTATLKASEPDIEGDAGYSYVTKGRKKLNVDSDHLVGKVDDLQDLVEDLRKDVVNRGVRPLPRQLEDVTKDITDLGKELKRMEEYMSQEKPIWTKIWEKELEDVCQGRDELRLMEDLMVDLRDDLEKAAETFTLVEQATKEQMKDIGTGQSAGAARQFSRGLGNLGNSLDPGAAKEDVLGEVRALQPNHEDRLEAIERAEKLRQKELQSRGGTEMQREIAAFVSEGKLKKSGGFEEVERKRIAKDEQARREVWERMNGLLSEGEEEDDDEEDEEEEEEEFEDAPDGEAAGTENGTEEDKAANDEDKPAN